MKKSIFKQKNLSVPTHVVCQHLLNLSLQPPVLTGGERGEAAPHADQHNFAAGGAEEFGDRPAFPAKINYMIFFWKFFQS